eukprot:8591767-Pyramimonas_sp.AAC.1
MGEEDEKGDDDRMMRRGRAPSPSPGRARARCSGARSSGGQRPHPPDAGAAVGPAVASEKSACPPEEGPSAGEP